MQEKPLYLTLLLVCINQLVARFLLAGEDITGLAPHQLFDKGVMRTFQIAHEFASMSCRENLMMVPSNQFGKLYGILGLVESGLPIKKGH